MKTEDIFFVGGLVFIGYWLLKKQPKVISVEPLESKPVTQVPQEQKTIIIDLNNQKPMRANDYIDSDVRRSFDASKSSTIAPPKVTIQRQF